MNTQDFKRKLTAVFSADVAGYSRLMGEDEAATVKTLESYKQIMFSLIKQHRGRVIDSPGDNLLAEFASVVDAVQCGVAVQNELKARNADLPETRKMQFRVGINLGDVIEEGDRIYGDGVNIAARLESCADPGGICVSKTAFDHIETKLPLGYHFIGEQTVKNIARPVGAYKVLMEPRVTGAEKKVKEQLVPVWRRKPILAGGIVVLLVVVGMVVWNFYWRAPKIELASVNKMAFPLPDKPSIAVLPFVNMSGDPKEDYFSDGLTEQIITSLSMVPRLFVIARNSTFVYKGKAVKVQTVAEEQGVRYVLEGGVQKSQDRVRITAQLIDAIKGHHLWSERYDRELKDLFALQDEIVRQIMTAIQVKLTEGEYASVPASGTSNLKALECYWRGLEHSNRWTKEDNAAARQWLEKAIELDPNFAVVWALLGATHDYDNSQGWSKSPAESQKRTAECVQKALSINESTPLALSLMGGIRNRQGKWDEGLEYKEKALAINPNDPRIMWSLALSLEFLGRLDEAIALGQKILRVSPYYPAMYLSYLASVYPAAGRYQETIQACELLLERSRKGEFNPLYAHVFLAEAYVGLGQMDKARAEAEEVMKIDPKYTLKGHRRLTYYKDPAIGERRLAALRKAGLPDKAPLPLPDKPSIAVLPFVNMSEDKSQEYFSDGITEEIISALSRVSGLFVIARNSSFTYKGKSVWIPDVARGLGVAYILEGSVRSAGDRVRITAQLIEGKTNHHIWSETYDRELKDVFALQDEITMKILTNVKVKLTGGEDQILPSAKRATNLQAYLKILEGIAYLNESKFTQARKLFEEALSLDQKAPAYGWLAWTYLMDVWFGPTATRAQSLGKAFEYAEKCLEQDDSNEGCNRTIGHAYLLKRDYAKALYYGNRSIELNLNSAISASMLGWTLRSVGQYEDAIKEYERALRLDPLNTRMTLTQMGTTYLMMRRYDDSISACKKALEGNFGNLAAHLTLAMAYSSSDKMDEARAAASDVLKVSPNFSVEHFAKALPYKNELDRVSMVDALHKAGLR